MCVSRTRKPVRNLVKLHFPQAEWKSRATRTSLHPVLVLEDHSMIPIMPSEFSPEPSIRLSNNMKHHEGWNREQPPYVKGEMLFLLGAKPWEAIPVLIRREWLAMIRYEATHQSVSP